MEAHINAVQRMQDHIQEHLDGDITMADLARVAKYSPWHSYRLFVQCLKMTPSVYIRRLEPIGTRGYIELRPVKEIQRKSDTGA